MLSIVGEAWNRLPVGLTSPDPAGPRSSALDV